MSGLWRGIARLPRLANSLVRFAGMTHLTAREAQTHRRARQRRPKGFDDCRCVSVQRRRNQLLQLHHTTQLFSLRARIGPRFAPFAIRYSAVGKAIIHPVCEIESSTMRNDWIPTPLETAMLIAATVFMSSGFVVLAMG